MKLCYTFFAIALLSIVFAQDSLFLPEWKTKEPGYKVVVLPDGVGADTGPYATMLKEGYQTRAANEGATCIQYEKIVWRKQHATTEDLSLFGQTEKHSSALFDNLNFLAAEALDFRSFSFQACVN